jgi:hypothetical protein
MLQILVSLSGGKEVIFRVVDLESKKTMKEIVMAEEGVFQKTVLEIDNKKLVREYKKRGLWGSEVEVFPSAYDNFSLKTFVFFSLSEDGGRLKNKGGDKVEKEQEELIQGVINQCEIVYLLFNSQYYKGKHS